ncbi:MAG: GspE/PulE/PilB domain-containing protein [Thermoanaerobaculia bacterium]
MHRQNLGEMLMAANLIDEVQMQIALAEQRQTGKRFGSTLVELKFIDENVLAAFLSKQIDVPCISLLHIDISRKVSRKMDRTLALQCKAVPVRIDENGRLEVAMVDPTDMDARAKLEKATSMTMTPLIAPESSIQTIIDRIYPDLVSPETTLSVRKPELPRNMPNDPIFWDIIEELDNTDLDERLVKIEKNLEQIWVLLEKVLRTLELGEAVHRTER